MLSKLGVMRSIKTPLWYIPSFFCGIGLFSLTTETTGATLNSFLQHYRTDSYLGETLKVSLEHLQLEPGVSGCPLSYDYDIWGELATDSWVKSLWEKALTFPLNPIEYILIGCKHHWNSWMWCNKKKKNREIGLQSSSLLLVLVNLTISQIELGLALN